MQPTKTLFTSLLWAFPCANLPVAGALSPSTQKVQTVAWTYDRPQTQKIVDHFVAKIPCDVPKHVAQLIVDYVVVDEPEALLRAFCRQIKEDFYNIHHAAAFFSDSSQAHTALSFSFARGFVNSRFCLYPSVEAEAHRRYPSKGQMLFFIDSFLDFTFSEEEALPARSLLYILESFFRQCTIQCHALHTTPPYEQTALFLTSLMRRYGILRCIALHKTHEEPHARALFRWYRQTCRQRGLPLTKRPHIHLTKHHLDALRQLLTPIALEVQVYYEIKEAIPLARRLLQTADPMVWRNTTGTL